MTDTAATRVADALREVILDGQLAPGSPLSQVRLAEQYGVSRIPVRDALQVLSAEGLVDLVSGATAVVRGMSIDELQELYEMRVAIEPVATRLGVPNMGRAAHLRMRQQFDVMETATEARTWLQANAAFHACVYMQANRPRMVELVERLRKLVDRYLHLHLKVIGHTGHLQEEHARILEAVERGDAAEAEAVTRTHLETSHEFILRYLLENAVSPDGVKVTSPQD
ncbi:GntR family transcriptional regulator [Aquipuribacter nitratireducens]|uniref:GntR family transcriptional regulator n=1 Tax=Aquipuribacter nitratireducens TaxID=650104 RepID=A0ABW0GJL4_9MICO